MRGTDGELKDSYINVRENKEFVVNIVSEELAEVMNKTATELPADVNEFEYAGLTAADSTMISAPRVAESPVSFECKVSQIIDVGDGSPGSGWVVLGEVVHIHVADELLLPNYRIDLDKLNPIGRLSGPLYARTTDRFEMKRDSSQVLPR